ncbi:MAG: rod shape-determining protein RodA [Candidatus Hydrogenedentes bacterium]|nr:rod shape-determining protein RodA [Candidatus Hydrogenedentota bacterium]
MSSIQRDLNLLDSHIRTFNYRNLSRIDWYLLGITFILIGFGLTALYSASQSLSADASFFSLYYVRQFIAFCLGLTIALAIVCIDYRALISLAPAMYIVVAGLLIAVLFIGTEAKGGQHWLRYGPFNLQPSELSKLALVYSLAWYLAAVRDRIQSALYFAGAFVISGGILVLILLQKDLGTALVLPPVVLMMLYAAGCRKRYLFSIVAVGVAMAATVFFAVDKLPLEEYQKSRIKSFVQPDADPLESGYQIIQTKIAVGSGQMWGKGVGKGTQTHLRFLPEFHTDFIFALIAEEMGFVGGFIVISLFALFLLRGIVLARDCPDLAGSLLAVGCVTIIGFHVFVNIAITLHLLPITGLPLPFLSQGGSFCVTTMMCVGTLLSVQVRKGFFD